MMRDNDSLKIGDWYDFFELSKTQSPTKTLSILAVFENEKMVKSGKFLIQIPAKMHFEKGEHVWLMIRNNREIKEHPLLNFILQDETSSA